ncbi:MAG: hypothetical protein GKC04_04205 [Methanomicrobiales archaeon]|nr:hypothetical protein [Methanomicrobiales archaeon]
MDSLLSADKGINGIQVTYRSGSGTASELFSYETLIAMGINVASLLDHPEYYGIDPSGPTLARIDFCRPDLHRHRG